MLLSFAVYGFLFFSVKTKNEKAVTLRVEVRNDFAKGESLRMIKALLVDNDEEIRKLEEFFVPKDGVTEFLSSLESLGRVRGITLTVGSVSVDPKTKGEASFKETLRIRLETSGVWQETFRFLGALESLPYELNIENVSFSLSSSEGALSFSEFPAKRVPSSNETWKGFFEITATKLK